MNDAMRWDIKTIVAIVAVCVTIWVAAFSAFLARERQLWSQDERISFLEHRVKTLEDKFYDYQKAHP